MSCSSQLQNAAVPIIDGVSISELNNNPNILEDDLFVFADESDESNYNINLTQLRNSILGLINAGDLLSYNGSSYTRVAIGSSGQYLTNSGGLLVWDDLPDGIDDILTTEGDIMYYGSGDYQRLPIGSSNQVLTVSGGIPSWEDKDFYEDPLSAAGDIVYRSSSNTTTRLPAGSTNQVLTIGSLGVPEWSGVAGYSSPLTTEGDILIHKGVILGEDRLGIGSDDQVLKVVSGLPSWQDINEYVDPITNNGDLLTRIGGTTTRLGIGSNGQALIVTGGLPSWQNIPDQGFEYPLSNTGDLMYDVSGTPTRLPIGTEGYLLVSVSGTPQWVDIASAFTITELEAGNGITIVSDEIDLGGSLTKDTSLIADQSGRDFVIASHNTNSYLDLYLDDSFSYFDVTLDNGTARSAIYSEFNLVQINANDGSASSTVEVNLSNSTLSTRLGTSIHGLIAGTTSLTVGNYSGNLFTPVHYILFDTGGVKPYNAYSFPTTDGTSGQAITTNGSGVLSWSDVGSVSVGSSGQIPRVNGTGDDFIYGSVFSDGSGISLSGNVVGTSNSASKSFAAGTSVTGSGSQITLYGGSSSIANDFWIGQFNDRVIQWDQSESELILGRSVGSTYRFQGLFPSYIELATIDINGYLETITTSSGYLYNNGSGSMSWSASVGFSVTNEANNRVITSVSSGNGNAEANLTFDGSTLSVTGSINSNSLTGTGNRVLYSNSGGTVNDLSNGTGYLYNNGSGTLSWGSSGLFYVTNQANNRVITSVSSGNANAEANLTFNGSTLIVTGDINSSSLAGSGNRILYSNGSGTIDNLATGTGYLYNNGSGSFSWSSISSGFTVTNESNNRVITSVSSGNGNAESNLTFDGFELVVDGDTTIHGDLNLAGLAPGENHVTMTDSSTIVTFIPNGGGYLYNDGSGGFSWGEIDSVEASINYTPTSYAVSNTSSGSISVVHFAGVRVGDVIIYSGEFECTPTTAGNPVSIAFFISGEGMDSNWYSSGVATNRTAESTGHIDRTVSGRISVRVDDSVSGLNYIYFSGTASYNP